MKSKSECDSSSEHLVRKAKFEGVVLAEVSREFSAITVENWDPTTRLASPKIQSQLNG